MANNERKNGNGALMRRFMPYLAKYKGVLCFDLFCAALTTLCDIILPKIMSTLTNSVGSLTAALVLKLAALYLVLRIIDAAAQPSPARSRRRSRNLRPSRSRSPRASR